MQTHTQLSTLNPHLHIHSVIVTHEDACIRAHNTGANSDALPCLHNQIETWKDTFFFFSRSFSLSFHPSLYWGEPFNLLSVDACALHSCVCVCFCKKCFDRQLKHRLFKIQHTHTNPALSLLSSAIESNPEWAADITNTHTLNLTGLLCAITVFPKRGARVCARARIHVLVTTFETALLSTCAFVSSGNQNSLTAYLWRRRLWAMGCHSDIQPSKRDFTWAREMKDYTANPPPPSVASA